MKIRKMPRNQRTICSYHFSDETKFEIRPGNGGTIEEHIKMLHAADDQ